MKQNSFIRVMAAIALMLAVGLNAEAQLGKKILQRAKNAAETKTQMEADRAVNKGLDNAADAIKNPPKGKGGSSDNTGDSSGNNDATSGSQSSSQVASGQSSDAGQPSASAPQAGSKTKLKPSEKAIANDPKASDETIEKGYTRSLSEIRACYEQLSDKVYYKPYYADECHYFYALGEDQEKLYQAEMNHVEVAYQITRNSGHMQDALKVEYRKYIKVKTPAYREKPAREGYVIIGQHTVHAYFAQFAADPAGITPYWDFLSGRMIQTAFRSFDAAAWVLENGEQSQIAITLEDGSKAKLVESFHLWQDKMSEELYRLKTLLYEQTPYNNVVATAIHVLKQMREANSNNNIPLLRTHFHRYETVIDDLKNHPKKVEDDNYFALVREYTTYEEKYEEWVSMAKMAAPPIAMPKTYDMGGDLAAKALATAKKQFGDSFAVDKVVFLSNTWQEFKEPNYPYRVMHRSLVAGLLTKQGDKWVIRQYNFSQHSDKQGGWKQEFQFSAGFDGLYEPRPVSYKP